MHDMTVPAAELTAFSFDRISLDFTHSHAKTETAQSKRAKRAIVKE